MKQKTNKMLIFTSLAAYFTYFIHGIGVYPGAVQTGVCSCLGCEALGRWHSGCKYGSICNCSTWTGTSDFLPFSGLCLTNTEEN